MELRRLFIRLCPPEQQAKVKFADLKIHELYWFTQVAVTRLAIRAYIWTLRIALSQHNRSSIEEPILNKQQHNIKERFNKTYLLFFRIVVLAHDPVRLFDQTEQDST
jgi:hypothetical protein